MSEHGSEHAPRVEDLRREEMRTPDEVAAMVRLKALGWGAKRIAAELGCARNTVRRWLVNGGWRPMASPSRSKKLDGLASWLAERFRRHAGNADVVRQELAAEKGIVVSLRTVERAVAPRGPPMDSGDGPLRHAQTTVRGGPDCTPIRGPVTTPIDTLTREVVLHPRLHAFARHWGFRVRACAPYRARTKGKDERGVGYVKRNAIAGRSFASWSAFEAHLEQWTREVADVRIHGTTGEVPIERFLRDEARALQPLAGRPPFQQSRELVRRVQADCCIEVDGNAYSVPWRLIGERVRVTVTAGEIRIAHGSHDVAAHALSSGRRSRVIDPAHFAGVAGAYDRPVRAAPGTAPAAAPPAPALLRPLAEYEAAIGGGWS